MGEALNSVGKVPVLQFPQDLVLVIVNSDMKEVKVSNVSRLWRPG